MSLAKTAARGGAIVLASQLIRVFLQFFSLIILARLIAPESFGLVAMVVAVFGVGEILRDCGLSTAAIQAKTLSQEQASNLFWFSCLFGLGLCLIGYFSSYLLANFYDRPELIDIAKVLSLTFLFNGLASQFKAKLNRELKFKQVVIVELSGTILSVSLAIYMAYLGYSYWAIVFQQVSLTFLYFILYLLLSKWLPSFPSRHAGTRELLSFGWNLMGAQILGYLSKSTPAILIGYKHGATSLGFFERAMQILMLPLNQLSSPSATIAVPILSRLQNTDQQKYNNFFLFGQNIIVHAVVLSLSFVATQNERLVLIVLGEPWLGVVPIFQALSIGGTFLVFSYSSYWIFLSKGITNKLFRLSLISKPLMIVLTALGLFWGAVGVALMYSFSLFISWLLSIYWLRHTGVPIKEMVVTPLFIGFVYFISAYISNRLISTQELGLYTGIIWGWIILLFLLLAFYFLLSPFRKSVNQVFEIKTYMKQAK